MSDRSTWQQLLAVRDELALQKHLLSMNLRDSLESLHQGLDTLERKFTAYLIDEGEALGKAEEAFFVGNEAEIKSLTDGFKALQKQAQDQNRSAPTDEC